MDDIDNDYTNSDILSCFNDNISDFDKQTLFTLLKIGVKQYYDTLLKKKLKEWNFNLSQLNIDLVNDVFPKYCNCLNINNNNNTNNSYKLLIGLTFIENKPILYMLYDAY